MFLAFYIYVFIYNIFINLSIQCMHFYNVQLTFSFSKVPWTVFS